MTILQHSVALNDHEKQQMREGGDDDKVVDQEKEEDYSSNLVFNQDDDELKEQEKEGNFPPRHDLVVGHNGESINIPHESGGTKSLSSLSLKKKQDRSQSAGRSRLYSGEVVVGSVTTTGYEREFSAFLAKMTKAMNEHANIMLTYYGTKLTDIDKDHMNRNKVDYEQRGEGNENENTFKEKLSYQRNVFQERLDRQRRNKDDFCIEQLSKVMDQTKMDLKQEDDPELKEFYRAMLRKSLDKIVK